jgi:hypothetical protein
MARTLLEEGASVRLGEEVHRWKALLAVQRHNFVMTEWKNEDDIKAELRELTAELRRLKEELRGMVEPSRPRSFASRQSSLSQLGLATAQDRKRRSRK